MIVIAVLIVGYLFWRRYKIKKGDIPEHTPPPLPAHVIALRRLEELRIRKLWQDGFTKQYHSEL